MSAMSSFKLGNANATAAGSPSTSVMYDSSGIAISFKSAAIFDSSRSVDATKPQLSFHASLYTSMITRTSASRFFMSTWRDFTSGMASMSS